MAKDPLQRNRPVQVMEVPTCSRSLAALVREIGVGPNYEQGIFLGASAPVGQRAGFAPRHFQGRTLRAGDHLVLLIENNGLDTGAGIDPEQA